MSKRKYVDFEFVTTVRPILSPKTNNSENTFNGGKTDPRNVRSGFRFFLEGPLLFIEWPPTGKTTWVPLANVNQAMLLPEATEEGAAS